MSCEKLKEFHEATETLENIAYRLEYLSKNFFVTGNDIVGKNYLNFQKKF